MLVTVSQDHVVRGRRQLPPVAEVSTTNSTDSVTTTTDTGNCEDVNFMKSAASIKRRLLASNKFVDQLMATVKTKRARLHRLREETLASGKKTGTLLWQPWPLPWRRGEKICADKEKQMKEEEAAVEAVRRLIQTIKVIVSLRTSKPCVKVRVIFPRRRTRRSLPIDSRSLVSK